MLTKTKLNKVTKLAGASIAHLEKIPAGIQKKLSADQLAELCGVFAAHIPAEKVQRKARIDFARIAKTVRGWFSVERIELPRLAIGVSAIRARLLSRR